MAGLWQILKNWADDETLYGEDLNAAVASIQENAVAAETEGYSTVNNVANDQRMDSMLNPYPNGARSYAQSVADELQQLRFMLAQITGNNEWHQAPSSTIQALYASLQSQTITSQNQLQSGPVNTTSGALALIPSGSANTVTRQGSAGTPLVVTINGTQYSFTTTVTLSGMSLAPSSNNTATAGSPVVDGRYAGEDGTKIPISSVGSNITALVGQIAAFKVVHSATTEYFIALVESATELSRARRGYFSGSTGTGIGRVALASSDIITLCRLTYVFVKTDGTLDVSYTSPVYNSVTPTSPSTGDYWYDTINKQWKKYSGFAFLTANATLLGVCIQDTTNCVGARTFEYFAAWDRLNTIFAELNSSGSQVSSSSWGQKVSVAGTTFDFGKSLASWTTSGPFASGVTLGASTTYYMYVTQQGEGLLDTVKPYDRKDDLYGQYHPYAPWRCVGQVSTNGSSVFINPYLYGEPNRLPAAPQGVGANPAALAGGGTPLGVDALAISATLSATSSTVTPTYVSASTVTLKTRGRPVLIMLCAEDTNQFSGAGYIEVSGTAGTPTLNLSIVRDGQTTAQAVSSMAFAGSNPTLFPPSSLAFIDFPPAGDHSWGLMLSMNSASNIGALNGCYLVVKEL